MYVAASQPREETRGVLGTEQGTRIDRRRTHLRRDGVIVLVDELVLVNLLPLNLPVREHLDPLGNERLFHERARRGRVGVGRAVGPPTIRSNDDGSDDVNIRSPRALSRLRVHDVHAPR